MKFLTLGLLAVVSLGSVFQAHASESCGKNVAKDFAKFLGPSYRLQGADPVKDDPALREGEEEVIAFYVSEAKNEETSYFLRFEPKDCRLITVRINNYSNVIGAPPRWIRKSRNTRVFKLVVPRYSSSS